MSNHPDNNWQNINTNAGGYYGSASGINGPRRSHRKKDIKEKKVTKELSGHTKSNNDFSEIQNLDNIKNTPSETIENLLNNECKPSGKSEQISTDNLIREDSKVLSLLKDFFMVVGICIGTLLIFVLFAMVY